MYKVFIILVNYKNYSDTIECLESIFKNKYKDFQLIIVDNSPTDESNNSILKWVSNYNTERISGTNLKYIETDEIACATASNIYEEQLVLVKAVNRGFSAANNVALKYIFKNGIDSSYIWILNNDTVIDSNSIVELLNFYTRPGTEDYVISSKMRFYHDQSKLQAIIGDYNKWIGRGSHIGENEEDHGQYDQYVVKETNYLVGASVFIPLKIAVNVGLMDESYFLYFEDLDWSLKIKQRGYKLGIQTSAIIYHK